MPMGGPNCKPIDSKSYGHAPPLDAAKAAFRAEYEA
jgi:hypothetical protein